jgi:hypothetical protein
MNKKDLYNNYLLKLEEMLINDDIEWINYILEYIYTGWLEQKDLDIIDNILQEATLYIELWEIEYKEETLKLIEEFNK